MKEIVFKPIGVIHSGYTEKKDVPIQGMYAGGSHGSVEVFAEYEEALKDVGGFSHLILLYHFHQADGPRLLLKPFLDKEVRGMFSIRHFNRPNPIGISIVKLTALKGRFLDVTDVDILDGTPLLDIKPYVPDFDTRSHVSSGWYSTASEKETFSGKPGNEV